MAEGQRRGRQRFSKATLEAIHDNKILGIRAGIEPHRFTGVWAVVVNERVFVRSWNDKPRGWHRAFADEPRGAIRLGTRELRVRARAVRAERMIEAIDRASAEKYRTPASRRYVRGFRLTRRRRTTTELLPAVTASPKGRQPRA